MVFRTNFLFIWVSCNVGFFYLMMYLVNSATVDDKLSYLTIYALFVGTLSVFRIFFSGLYIAAWKITFWTSPRYRQIDE
jgi:hypothetical protein